MAAPARPQLPPDQPFGTFRLLELPIGRCRFPCASNGSDHRFCGRPAVHHHPKREAVWCVEHRDIVFVDWRPGGHVLRRAGRA